jgi:NHL repeat
LSGSDYFVADTYNHTIRKLNGSTGAVTTIAGTAGTWGSTDGTGAAALFNGPKSLVSDGTNLYVTDTSNHSIRQVVISTGVTTTLAGYGSYSVSGTSDGTGSTARFYAPFGVTIQGVNLYVTDTGNHTIRKVTPGGVTTTLAGTAGTYGSADATGTSALFNTPTGIVSDGTNLYVADSRNHTIRKVVIVGGAVTTLAGTAGSSGSADGTGAAARFSQPVGLTIDNAGNLYVSDQNYTKIRKIVTSTGVVTTISATF